MVVEPPPEQFFTIDIFDYVNRKLIRTGLEPQPNSIRKSGNLRLLCSSIAAIWLDNFRQGQYTTHYHSCQDTPSKFPCFGMGY